MRSGRCRISATTMAQRASFPAATSSIPRRNTARSTTLLPRPCRPAVSCCSDARRYAFSCAYCWGWMRQQENLQLGIPRETAIGFPRRLQELCGYSVYKGQFGHIDNRDPIELLGRERGKRMVWEATDAKKARMAETAKR